MSNLRFQTKSNEVAEICYYDEASNSWIPISESSPLPTISFNSLVNTKFDNILIGYDSYGNVINVIYKFAGSVVKTLNVSYDSNFNMTEVSAT